MPDGAGPLHVFGWPASMRAERAAAYLDVSKTYFLGSIAPQLAPIRLGPGLVLYLRRDLDAWLDQRAGAAAPSPEDNPWPKA